MIIPSVDIMGGNAVQLVGGRELAIDAGDPRPIARQFGLVGEIAVIDLDAALGQGSNEQIIRELSEVARIRVGGGIRSVESAIRWLDAGAARIILGTAAKPEILSQLPRERTMAALDAENGQIVVEGWRTATGKTILDRIAELRPYVSGFLVTFVELEGRLGGTALDQVAAIVEAAGDARVTIAGGISTPAEIAELEQLGADAQVGMALYSGRIDLADALWAGQGNALVPTVVVDEQGRALGLAYSTVESLRVALTTQRGVYWSRKRGLWIKGETSGNTQDLLRVDWDCDRDCLRFTVRQSGPFCHLETRTCWGPPWGLARLEETVSQRLQDAPAGSYTKRLATEDGLLDKKILEEAAEVVSANGNLIHEAADLIYFLSVKLQQSGLGLSDVGAVLEQRSRKVTRRKGDAK